MHETGINILGTLAQVQWLVQKGPGEAFLAVIADKPTGTENGGKSKEGWIEARRERGVQDCTSFSIGYWYHWNGPSPCLPLYMHELANFFGGSTPLVPVKRIADFMRVFQRFHVKLS